MAVFNICLKLAMFSYSFVFGVVVFPKVTLYLIFCKVGDICTYATDGISKERIDLFSFFPFCSQIKSPHDKGISQCIAENRIPWENSWEISLVNPLIKDPYEEICASYFEDIKKYCHYR